MRMRLIQQRPHLKIPIKNPAPPRSTNQVNFYVHVRHGGSFLEPYHPRISLPNPAPPRSTGQVTFFLHLKQAGSVLRHCTTPPTLCQVLYSILVISTSQMANIPQLHRLPPPRQVVQVCKVLLPQIELFRRFQAILGDFSLS